MEIYDTRKDAIQAPCKSYAYWWPAFEKAYVICARKTYSTEAVVCQLREVLSSLASSDALLKATLTGFCRNFLRELLKVSLDDDQAGQLETTNLALLLTLQ